ncbi:MAG: LysM peptidoglycan-binding domain-containing protein [Ilumatobacteraceae bacterium]
MKIRTRYVLAALIAASTLFVDAGNVSARECANSYTARRGDSWWKIAVKSNITLKKILTINKASMKTIILIGDDVCVPVKTQPIAPPVVTTYARKEVEQIIRDIWPDDLEDRALAIAQRESNLSPHAANNCCYGLFQIYYKYHKNWLPGVGVTSAKQLLDPRLNALAAYTLYQRNNGWGPWKL